MIAESTPPIDRSGRLRLVHEDCRTCGHKSTESHPAGVVAGKWHCRCGRWQNRPQPCPEWPDCGDDDGPCQACAEYASYLANQLEGD